MLSTSPPNLAGDQVRQAPLPQTRMGTRLAKHPIASNR